MVNKINGKERSGALEVIDKAPVAEIKN
ncbi:hypothetical protein S96127_2545 [Yersinia pestis]|nr:hypothetical protein S96127_2545 [Yersinia pestis]